MSLFFPSVRNIRAQPGRSAWQYGIILLICGAAIAWAVYSPRYYAWALGRERISIVVFCDTSDLNDPNLQAFVMYDELALTPLAKALGLYQNRPPQRVKVVFAQPASDFELTPYSITLKNVRWGPIVRLAFVARGRHFQINVPDRRLIKGALYVRSASSSAPAGMYENAE